MEAANGLQDSSSSSSPSRLAIRKSLPSYCKHKMHTLDDFLMSRVT